VARLIDAADPAALEERTRRGFAARFGRDARIVASAPGRANLIGEHTDYNDGFVLPFAIARRTAVAAAPRADRVVEVAGAFAPGTLRLSLDAPIGRGEPRWGDYVRGVIDECLVLPQGALDPGGFDAWIESDVPAGAGLSSSAALEVAIAAAIEMLARRTLDPLAKAALCRRAEHRFAGVPCGIMDQMASVLARENELLLIDCRSLEFVHVELPASAGVEIVVVDSELPHDLGEGEFAKRVEQCSAAATKLGLASLRDARQGDLERLACDEDSILYARARHVVDENRRVHEAVAAIRTNDWSRLGALLDESHASLRDLYQVSRPEMDALVEDLRCAGALGARMTGGGFGGCAVALFERGATRSLAPPRWPKNTGSRSSPA